MIRHRKVATDVEPPGDPAFVAADDWNDDHFPMPGLPVFISGAKLVLDTVYNEFGFQTEQGFFGLYDPESIDEFGALGSPNRRQIRFSVTLPDAPIGYEWRLFTQGAVYYGINTAPGSASPPSVSFLLISGLVYCIADYTSATTDGAHIDLAVYGYLMEVES